MKVSWVVYWKGANNNGKLNYSQLFFCLIFYFFFFYWFVTWGQYRLTINHLLSGSYNKIKICSFFHIFFFSPLSPFGTLKRVLWKYSRFLEKILGIWPMYRRRARVIPRKQTFTVFTFKEGTRDAHIFHLNVVYLWESPASRLVHTLWR